MSRFRMHTIQYRRWAPAQSPLRIEFGMELFREMRMEIGRPEGIGVLYGVRHHADVRVLAARRAADPNDPRLANYEPLGICILRERGHVFLTEADIEKFLKARATVALVVAGDKAGFFVRDAKGAVQSIQSYEEFSIAEPKLPAAANPAPRARQARRLPRTRIRRRKKLPWWPVAACAAIALVSIPLLARPLWQPLLAKTPLALAIREEAGQVLVSWSPGAIRGTGTLEIAEGDRRLIEPVTADQASFTYQPQLGDVNVRLTAYDRYGKPRVETARFIGARTPVISADPNLSELENEAALLRQASARGRARVAELQTLIALLESRR